MANASVRWIVQLHRDVPKAARFYADGLGLCLQVCTVNWAELTCSSSSASSSSSPGSLRLALMRAPSDLTPQKCYTSFLSFNVADMNSTVTKLISLGAELDGPIKHEVHGKVAAVRLDDHMLGLYEPA